MAHAGSQPAAGEPTPEAARDAGQSEPEKEDAVSAPQVKQPLPDTIDQGVAAVLALPVADDVIVAYAYVGRGKSPAGNFRFELHDDGRIYSVEHSGSGRDWQVPFDRLMPAKPVRKLSAKEIAGIRSELEQADFFSHPGYEAVAGTKGGAYTIVRARKDGLLHTVVYENAKQPLLDYLYDVAY